MSLLGKKTMSWGSSTWRWKTKKLF